MEGTQGKVILSWSLLEWMKKLICIAVSQASGLSLLDAVGALSLGESMG